MSRGSSGLNAHDRVMTNVGLTADTGSAQAGATQLYEGVNVVATCANIGDSVVLPLAADAFVGMVVRVFNNGANATDVFPGVGDDLGAGANTAASLAAGANISYCYTSANTWEALS